MPRRGYVAKREVPVDPVFGSELATQFVNKLMIGGQKSRAEGIFYGAMKIVQDKSGKDPIEVLEEAMKNVMPVLEVKPRRVGGATYQVPVEVRPERRTALALRWLVQYARERSEKRMVDRLALEILDAASNTGSSVRKREDIHRMAEANKAFAHYRW